LRSSAIPDRRERALVRVRPTRRRRFKRAWEAQDIDALIGLLDPAATAVADGGGLAVTFLSRIEGGEQIAGAWMEIARRRPETMTFSERTVNGQPGLMAEQGGTVVTVFAFDVVGDRITRIWVVRNPEKLSHRTAA
jgi:RNA polymerase sigma-70 factor (ECF subfamily)